MQWKLMINTPSEIANNCLRVRGVVLDNDRERVSNASFLLDLGIYLHG